MARIEFTGFVQKHEGNRPWEIAENHRTQVDGKWVTKSTTYHKIWLPKDLTELPVDALVKVTGNQVTPEKKGDYKPTPVVYADSVTDKDGKPLVVAIPDPYQPSGEPSPDGWESQDVPF